MCTSGTLPIERWICPVFAETTFLHALNMRPAITYVTLDHHLYHVPRSELHYRTALTINIPQDAWFRAVVLWGMLFVIDRWWHWEWSWGDHRTRQNCWCVWIQIIINVHKVICNAFGGVCWQLLTHWISNKDDTIHDICTWLVMQWYTMSTDGITAILAGVFSWSFLLSVSL